MAKIGIIAVGRLKTGYYDAACRDYSARIKRYASIKIVEIKEYPLPKNPSDKEIEAAKIDEGNRLAEAAKAYDTVFCLDIKGKKLTSEGLSDLISRQFTTGKNSIAFLIGGSNGLSDEMKAVADGCISFSDMTFAHHLFRVMLLEQVYRAFTIINNEKYHK